MKDRDIEHELAFLRYRRTVVESWPETETQLKAATLALIESRLNAVKRLPRLADPPEWKYAAAPKKATSA
jgi:hypothetical protein